jgi:hypothetical protein
MTIKDITFADGLRAQLASQNPLPETDQNPLYTLMQDRDLDGYALGKLARAIHTHRPFETNALGENVQGLEKATLLLTNATPDRISFAITDPRPSQQDATYNTYARTTLERDDKGVWHVSDFFTSLDPAGCDQEDAHRYVDLADGLRGAYKENDQKFVADFLQSLSKGDDLWGALTTADYLGKIDTIFAAARKNEQNRMDAGEAPVSLMKIKAGRVDGTYAYFNGGEDNAARRVSVAPIMKND